ncbi:Actin cross-linking [Beauveria brongniartii RCEF 3172]|uniref:Actin cross-linking n=1 Tax=Beauveria brongniartii RCEF 3172 TaxID=1081107 RepID=A0A166VP39_9HYPO|nr:Actin cross-linking [Beauveria brongniartii RCEF 3172]
MSSPVENAKTYFLHVHGGGVVSQIAGRTSENEVHIRPKNGSAGQQWTAELNHHNFGFRSQKNDNFLGSNGNGDIQATAAQLKAWETFSVDPVENGYRLSVNKDGTWKTVARPAEADYLHLSNSEYTPITFEQVKD